MLAPTLSERDTDIAEREAAGLRADLRSDCLDALLKDPTRRIPTPPGWGTVTVPAFDAVIDEMAGRDSDDMRARICTIVRLAAMQKGDVKLQEMALRFCMDVADKFAESGA